MLGAPTRTLTFAPTGAGRPNPLKLIDPFFFTPLGLAMRLNNNPVINSTSREFLQAGIGFAALHFRGGSQPFHGPGRTPICPGKTGGLPSLGGRYAFRLRVGDIGDC